jgi:hypothetical protein
MTVSENFFRYNVVWSPNYRPILESLWWRFIPGVTFDVKWPVGQVNVGPGHREGWCGLGPAFEYIHSADPNDHYRPWLEEHIGKQGWDWNWCISHTDVGDRVTIKVRQKYAKYAIIAALRWS